MPKEARKPDRSKRSRDLAAGKTGAKKRVNWGQVFFVAGLLLVMSSIIGAAVVTNAIESRWVNDVKVYDYKGGTHLGEPVTYKETPPVGGEHAAAWQNCGFYTEPIPNETAVHSLEHGAVWLTYRPGLPVDQVNRLRAYTYRSAYVLVSPVEGQPSDVVATAWNHQLVLDGAEDERLDKFVTRYVQGPQTPEPGAACSNGYGIPN